MTGSVLGSSFLGFAFGSRLGRLGAGSLGRGCSASTLLRTASNVSLFPIVLLCGLGCASRVPDEVSSARTFRLTYHDLKTGRDLSLVSRSDPEYADLYSHAQRDASMKLATDEQLSAIVDAATEASYFEYAGNLSSPDDIEGQRAFKLFVIRADGRPFSLLLAEGIGQANPDIVVTFNEVSKRFFDEYNSINSLQWVDPKVAGSDFFKKEQERLERERKGEGAEEPRGGLR